MKLEVWARSRETKQYEKLKDFYDYNNIDFEMDQVDSNLYSEVMIISEHHLIKHKEFKDYTPYFKKYKKSKRGKNYDKN